MKKITLILTVALLVLSFVAINLQLSPDVLAAPKDEICSGIGAASGSACGGGGDLTRVIRTVVNIFSMIVGVVAVIMLMVAGFKYITSAGDSGNITSAKHTFTYALIGLVIVALSQSIVKFVLEKI